MSEAPVVLVGGAGFVGTAAARVLADAGRDVVVVDAREPIDIAQDVRWMELDLLQDEVTLPDGEVVVLVGNGHPRPRRRWELALQGPLATARLLPALAGRAVTLISSVEVYGTADGELDEGAPLVLPADDSQLCAWNAEALRLAQEPCPPWRAAPACRRLVEMDPSGRWAYALSKRAQELLLFEHEAIESLTVLRLANAFGVGQERVVSRLARRARCGRPMEITEGVVRSLLPVSEVGRALLFGLSPGTYNLGTTPVSLTWLAERLRALAGSSSPILPRPAPTEDHSGRIRCEAIDRTGFRLRPLEDGLRAFVDRLAREPAPLFSPPVEVVIPPRPENPDEVTRHQQEALWRGRVKHGQRWSATLSDELRSNLKLAPERELLLTVSGTDALRLSIVATVGPGRAGDIALVPSFTFPATVEVLAQLGYEIRFVDVEERTWTLDPSEVETALASEPRARLVVAVDTFGNPCDYELLNGVCNSFGVALVADSAAALGSRRGGQPIAVQAAAHSFSMSFAKVISAAGAGGAVVFRDPPRWPAAAGWTRSALMDEIHAVAALDQLRAIEDLVARREMVADLYEQGIADLPGLVAQHVDPGDTHSRVHWVMRVLGRGRRDALATELDALGVGTKNYFRALHLGSHPDPARLPVTELLDEEVLALPMSSELVREDAEAIIAALHEAELRCPAPDEEVLSEVGEEGLAGELTLEA